MAKRPVFIADVNPPFFKEEEVEFFFYSGFAPVQKQKSMSTLSSECLKCLLSQTIWKVLNLVRFI